MEGKAAPWEQYTSGPAEKQGGGAC